MKYTVYYLIFTITIICSHTSFSQTARLQVIHNCPDTIVDSLDVYLDNALLIPAFTFQSATPYTDVPAGIGFEMILTTAGQGDTTTPLFRKSFLLAVDSIYVIVASGEVGNAGSNGFDLRIYSGQETATNSGVSEISLKFIHGSYDAPTIDVFEQVVNEEEIFSNISFGEDSGYLDLDATALSFQVLAQDGQVIGEFDANFISFEDSAIIVLSSGFIDTTGTAGIEPFGLIAVFSNGNVNKLPQKSITPARIQFIHNCAATDAATVDVWLNAEPLPLIDNFTFRTATAFIDAPAGVFFDLSICLPNSTDTSNALFRKRFILESNKTYIIVVSGIIGAGNYIPSTPFSLDVIPDARQIADISSNVDILIWHGATDAPFIDIAETQIGAGTIVNDISYGTYDGYISLPTLDYDLTIYDSSGTLEIASYDANFFPFSGQAITILTSGFLSPGNNNNGAEFGLWVSTSTGGNLIPLSIIIGVNEPDILSEINLYPNPTQNNINLNGEFGNAIYTIYNSNGRLVKTEEFPKGLMKCIDVSNLNCGIYLLNIYTGKKQFKKLFSKL